LRRKTGQIAGAWPGFCFAFACTIIGQGETTGKGRFSSGAGRGIGFHRLLVSAMDASYSFIASFHGFACAISYITLDLSFLLALLFLLLIKLG